MSGIIVSRADRISEEALADVLRPPPPIDYAKWAGENITFSDRESPFPGPYNADLFPFFTEILNALGPDDPCREVSFVKSAQLGGTVLANIFLLGSMDMDPGDFLFIHPTEDNGRRWSKMKLAPMLRSTTALARVFPERSRESTDSVMYKERVDGRGAILISGANSPSSLSQVSMRRQVQDDLAKWVMNSAGDPETQANSRSRGFEFAKIFKASTPLVMPGCRITKNFDDGTQEVFEVPCPHCQQMQSLEWENMLSHLDEERPEDAHFVCINPECGCLIEEHHRAEMVRKGRWVARNPKARNRHRSFYLWSAYGPLQSWGRIAEEWLKAKGDPESERVFLNDTVGLAYRAESESPPWEELRDRAAEFGHPRGRIPAGGLVLTVGVDCQKDHIKFQVVAWGRDRRRYVIDYGMIDGHISEPTCQAGLNDLARQTWRNAAGNEIGVDNLAIDGNAWTEDVWDWAKKHSAQKVMMVRGRGDDSAPLLERVKKERNRLGVLLKWSKRFYNFAASVLKMALYRNLAKTDPMERGFVGLPRDMEDEYFQELTAERRIPKRSKEGFVTYKWEKDPAQRNEALDTMNQAEAAAIKYGVRRMPDSAWDQIEAVRDKPPETGQLDLEDWTEAQTAAPRNEGGGSASAPQKPKPKPKPAAARKRRRSGWMNGI